MIAPGSVKICSLREVEHARFVLDAGADLFGLIFVSGARRQIAPERAREIIRAVREGDTGKKPLAVGVFVDATASEINQIIQFAGLDIVQLNGNEPASLLAELDAPVIRAVRPAPGMSVVEVDSIVAGYARSTRPPVAFLVDGFHEVHHGGQGIRADWSLATELASRWPLMLAGGLSPETVAGAISTVHPLGVDVSTGVETDGVKDLDKISAFVINAKLGFAKDLI